MTKTVKFKDATLEELRILRKELIKRYIGTFDKPKSYYNSLEVLNGHIANLTN